MCKLIVVELNLTEESGGCVYDAPQIEVSPWEQDNPRGFIFPENMLAEIIGAIYPDAIKASNALDNYTRDRYIYEPLSGMEFNYVLDKCRTIQYALLEGK